MGLRHDILHMEDTYGMKLYKIMVQLPRLSALSLEGELYTQEYKKELSKLGHLDELHLNFTNAECVDLFVSNNLNLTRVSLSTCCMNNGKTISKLKYLKILDLVDFGSTRL